MKDPLLKVVKDFLEARLRPKEPVLLGYSGGPDSKALLYLLLECKQFLEFDIHLAHIDHGWREESGAEAEMLRCEASHLGLPLHLLTLTSGSFKAGNLEEQARNLRLKFFRELYQQHGYQALLLAHQADDQAEVVLKRLCEGAHFSKLSGFSEENCIDGMQIWRPLKPLRKKQLISWLEKRQLTAFNDLTNLSPRFLRGRMRTQILPLLTEGFGKEVVENLCYLGATAEQIAQYFFIKVSPYLQNIKKGPLGSYLDLPHDLEELELQFLLKEWIKVEKVELARDTIVRVCVAWRTVGPLVQFSTSKGLIYVDRNRVFLLKRELQN